jgi:hypothetical protein
MAEKAIDTTEHLVINKFKRKSLNLEKKKCLQIAERQTHRRIIEA